MTLILPNRANLTGDYTFSLPFGSVCSVYPARHVPGLGHVEYLKVQFVGGFSMRLTPESATQLAREIPSALAALASFPDVSGSVWAAE